MFALKFYGFKAPFDNKMENNRKIIYFCEKLENKLRDVVRSTLSFLLLFFIITMVIKKNFFPRPFVTMIFWGFSLSLVLFFESQPYTPCLR
ncbi:hypothetical protein LguiA_024602 [Lonicera macranthoides]